MASWKKVIVSGSKAVLAEVTASAGFSGDGSGLTGITAGAVTFANVTGKPALVSGSGQINDLINDTIAATIVAEIDNDEIPIAKLASDAITIGGAGSTALGGTATAANILKGSTALSGSMAANLKGTTVLSGSVTLPSGVVSASAQVQGGSISQNTISVGGVTLTLNGTDATPAFDLSDATAYTGDSDLVTVGAVNGGSITSGFGSINNGASAITTTGTISGGTINATGTISGSVISASGGFHGDGSALTGITAGAVTFANVTGKPALVSGSGQINDLINDTIAATIVAEIDNDEIPIAKLASDSVTIGTTEVTLGASSTTLAGMTAVSYASSNGTLGAGLGANTLTVGDATSTIKIQGNLQVDGEQTIVSSSNLLVADQFALFNSGSTSGDGGIVVQTGASGVGTALAFDDSAVRWGLSEVDGTAQDATTFTPRQYLVSVSSSAADPGDDPSNFGNNQASRAGLMHVRTDTEEIWIYS